MDNISFILAKDDNGNSYLEQYLDSIPDKEADKLLARISLVEDERLEKSKSLQYVKKLDDNLYEIRCRVGSNQQRAIYFHLENNQYVITHGFTKKIRKHRFVKLKKQRK